MTLRDFGLALVRRFPGLDAMARRVYGALPSALHDDPTSRLRRFFASFEAVTFVQLGAFDGCAGDPIRPLVVDNPGWRGVLVEPQPRAYAALVENYRAQASRLSFVEAAVAPDAGEMTLHVVAEDDLQRHGRPAWLRETASFESEHIRKHARDCRIDEITVKTLPFSDLAGRLPHGFVDLVVIDVEGFERVVMESIDLDRHRIRVVVYEHKHLSARDAGIVDALLRRHRFSTKAFGRDTVAWRSIDRGPPDPPDDGSA